MEETRDLLPPLGIDSFIGKVADFQEYLKAQRLYLKAGTIV